MDEYILDETWKNTPVDLTSNLLLLQRITDALRLSTLSPQSVFVWVGNKDLYDVDGDDGNGFYVGDTYYMHTNSQQGWREDSIGGGRDPNDKQPSGGTIRVRLIYSQPPSILLNNHQRILDTVTALKRHIGGCGWGEKRRLLLHSMRECIEGGHRRYYVECCWSSAILDPEWGLQKAEKKRGREEDYQLTPGW